MSRCVCSPAAGVMCLVLGRKRGGLVLASVCYHPVLWRRMDHTHTYTLMRAHTCTHTHTRTHTHARTHAHTHINAHTHTHTHTHTHLNACMQRARKLPGAVWHGQWREGGGGGGRGGGQRDPCCPHAHEARLAAGGSGSCGLGACACSCCSLGTLQAWEVWWHAADHSHELCEGVHFFARRHFWCSPAAAPIRQQVL